MNMLLSKFHIDVYKRQVFFGTLIGILVGAMPGLSSIMGLSIMMPLTLSLDGNAGMPVSYTHLERELKHFAQNIGWMLEDYFEELPSRKREAYAEAFAHYCTDISGAIQDLSLIHIFPVQILRPPGCCLEPVAEGFHIITHRESPPISDTQYHDLTSIAIPTRQSYQFVSKFKAAPGKSGAAVFYWVSCLPIFRLIHSRSSSLGITMRVPILSAGKPSDRANS